MSEDDWEAQKAGWDDRLSSEEPVVSYRFDLPVKLIELPEGEVAIDCPCFQLVGFDRVGTVRVQLSQESAQILLQGLLKLKNSLNWPDEIISPHRPQ